MIELSAGFNSNYAVKIDSALRVAIPAKFREVLDKKYGASATQVVLVPDKGKVKVLPVPVWQKMEDELNSLPELDPVSDKYRTFVFGNMSFCQLDVQNRIRLTPTLCRLAGLEKNVVFVGRQNQMEIWDAAKWDEFIMATVTGLDEMKSQASQSFQRK
jgi:MraZ protein